MGEAKKRAFRVRFDSKLKLEFHGARVTSDAGLLAYRELDDVFGLTEIGAAHLFDPRRGRNTQHSKTALARRNRNHYSPGAPPARCPKPPRPRTEQS